MSLLNEVIHKNGRYARAAAAGIDVLITGQATIDDIIREDEGLVSKETPGGDSIYATLGASVWPVKIGVVTVVGEDYPRDKLARATCSPERTNWSGLQFVDGPSIHDQAYYYNDGSRRYVFNDDNLLYRLSPVPADIPPAFADCPYAHVAPANVDSQLELVRYFKSKNAVVTLDVETHFFADRKEMVMEMLALDPIFVPSVEHVQLLSGVNSRDPLKLWPWVRTCGSSLVVVKCGGDGAYLFDVPAKLLYTISIVPDLTIGDVTGAGDSYCGGFLAGLALTHDPLQAAAYGAVSASFIVESWAAVRPAHFCTPLAEERLEIVRRSLLNLPVRLP